MTHTELIIEFFDTHFEYGPGFKAENEPEAAWDRDVDRLHTPFGFAVPEIADDRWHLRYSADVIAKQTKLLSEEELDTYLHALQVHIDQHVTHGDLDPESIEAQADHLLYSLSPDAMELVNRVQLQSI